MNLKSWALNSNKFYILNSFIISGIVCSFFIRDEDLNSFSGSDPILEQFSCGGGPFSVFMATLISTTCNRQPIDSCCSAHDICYDSLHLNQTFCDEIFCQCLNTIPDSLYCTSIAHPGLCLATHVFGHLFHWTANCTGDCIPEQIQKLHNISLSATNAEAALRNATTKMVKDSQNIQGFSTSSIKNL